jgi:Predicted membrane protein
VKQPAGRSLNFNGCYFNGLLEGDISMVLIWTLIIGLIVGAVAKLLMPGKDPGGIIITMLLGIAGAFVGTFIGRALGLYQDGASAGFLMSVIGAIILLWIYRMFRRRKTT